MTAKPLPCQDLPVNRSETDHPKTTSNPTDHQGYPGDAKASSADGIDQSVIPGRLPASSSDVPIPTLGGVPVCHGSDGNAYITIKDGSNARALRIGSKQADLFIRRLAHQAGNRLKRNDIRDINDDLIAHAECSGATSDVWYRVAPFRDGIELDVGDDRHTRIRVTPGKVEIITEGSTTLFHRPPPMRPFIMPDDQGDLSLLDKYLNLHETDIVLLKTYIGYTLAHPKVKSTNFPILVLQGDQGSGKTTLCQIIQALIDPSVVGVQTFPSNQKDLAIAAQNAHALFYDNMRNIKPSMADNLSTAATGGALTSRQLYTSDVQHVLWLHVALVLNGIHSFTDQPDLAQRCLPIHLRSIDEKGRRSESEFIREFQADLPKIFRGLLDLIADVLKELPSAEVTNPERMIDFVHWLAAMEKVDEAPTGVYQAQYSDTLKESMLDSLLENPLAAAILSSVADHAHASWSGKPSDILQELNLLVGHRSRSSQDWPQNPIALSKRLKSLKAALLRQGIDIEFGRGHERRISIARKEAS